MNNIEILKKNIIYAKNHDLPVHGNWVWER